MFYFCIVNISLYAERPKSAPVNQPNIEWVINWYSLKSAFKLLPPPPIPSLSWLCRSRQWLLENVFELYLLFISSRAHNTTDEQMAVLRRLTSVKSNIFFEGFVVKPNFIFRSIVWDQREGSSRFHASWLRRPTALCSETGSEAFLPERGWNFQDDTDYKLYLSAENFPASILKFSSWDRLCDNDACTEVNSLGLTDTLCRDLTDLHFVLFCF